MKTRSGYLIEGSKMGKAQLELFCFGRLSTVMLQTSSVTFYIRRVEGWPLRSCRKRRVHEPDVFKR